MSRRVRIVRFNNRFGLHMRPATEVVRISSAYKAKITLSVAGNQAGAHSIFELLILGIRQGDWVKVSAIGHDAEDALDTLCTFLGFCGGLDSLPDHSGGGGHDSCAA